MKPGNNPGNNRDKYANSRVLFPGSTLFPGGDPEMLTDKNCKNAVCPEGKNRARFTDASGLYLEVSPAGSKRWFWKTYADGKEGRMALGRYPSMTLSEARKARDAAKLHKSEGRNPVELRKVQKLRAIRPKGAIPSRPWHCSGTPNRPRNGVQAMQRDPYASWSAT